MHEQSAVTGRVATGYNYSNVDHLIATAASATDMVVIIIAVIDTGQ